MRMDFDAKIKVGAILASENCWDALWSAFRYWYVVIGLMLIAGLIYLIFFVINPINRDREKRLQEFSAPVPSQQTPTK